MMFNVHVLNTDLILPINLKKGELGYSGNGASKPYINLKKGAYMVRMNGDRFRISGKDIGYINVDGTNIFDKVTGYVGYQTIPFKDLLIGIDIAKVHRHVTAISDSELLNSDACAPFFTQRDGTARYHFIRPTEDSGFTCHNVRQLVNDGPNNPEAIQFEGLFRGFKFAAINELEIGSGGGYSHIFSVYYDIPGHFMREEMAGSAVCNYSF